MFNLVYRGSCIVHLGYSKKLATGCGDTGGDADLAAGAVGMAAAMEEEREAEQAARQGQQVLSYTTTIRKTSMHYYHAPLPPPTPLSSPATTPAPLPWLDLDCCPQLHDLPLPQRCRAASCMQDRPCKESRSGLLWIQRTTLASL